ncbi:MAG: CRTAC1 family protein, partial [Flavobacteriales bacterium]
MSNCLQLNRNNQVFSEIAQLSGVAKSDWSWSPLFADVDNDGFKDLMITNGYKRDTKDQDLRARIDSLKEKSNSVSLDVLLDQFNSTKVSNKIYRNNTDLTFKESNAEWNFNQEVHSHGAVLVDLDNDGDLDIITNNVDEKASIIENQLSNKNWIQIDGSCISEPGTELLLYSKLGTQRQLVQATRGYASSVVAPVHFGLNQLESIDSLVINYIDGRQEVIFKLDLNKKNSINKGATHLKPRNTREEPLFEVHSPKSILAFAHRENTYNDFDNEVLLPHKMSREGPALAAGDVNGDGLVDAWIGSSAGLNAALFAQGKDGKFIGF